MNITFRIAFRNLIRQKRRNLLLGTGIAFGIMVLFVSQSYTKGLSDILINSLISRIFGHIQINVTEKTDRTISIIRDKNQVIDTINNTIDGVSYYWESVSTLTRAVGNGTGALMVVVGVNTGNSDFFKHLNVIDGDVSAFTEESLTPPLILYSPKAEELNVTAGDTVNIKLTTIYGQIQSAQMRVAAIVKPENIFMTMAGFISLETLKSLLGYRPHETSRINIVLDRVDKPAETAEKADLLHRAFTPAPLFVNVSITGNSNKTDAIAGGLQTAPELNTLFQSEFNLPENTAGAFNDNPHAVIIGEQVSNTLNVSAHDRVRIGYGTKFDGFHSPDTEFTVAGIIHHTTGAYDNTVFFNASGFTKLTSEYLPSTPVDPARLNHLENRNMLMGSIVHNKTLLERPSDSKELKQMLKGIRSYRQPGSLMHITSMKEIADDVLKIESVLNLICMVTVIILFAIILTGSVNALRMTIRERTREIGTVRSIGMPKKSVVRIFVIESALLSLFASLAGIGAAFIIMITLSGITFEVDNLFSILIDNGHLHFLPEFKTVLADILVTVTITVLTTWLPAKKAAAMPVTEALRHYE